MRRGNKRVSRLTAVLAMAVGLLTPMAANMAGAAAGTPAVVPQLAPVRLLVPRSVHPPTADRDGQPVGVAREAARRAARIARWTNLLVPVPGTLPAYARPSADSRRVGVVPAGSKYYGIATVAWVEERSADGRWGRVELPYRWPRVEGWIRIARLPTRTTRFRVVVDLSRHLVIVTKLGRVVFRAPAATGSPSSPTPVGEYFVTDRVPFSVGGALGSFAFGISGIQPRLPAGWTGGNQLAIHGTNQPWSIGQSVSAGCVRVSESTLARLQPLLVYGTPVVIHA